MKISYSAGNQDLCLVTETESDHYKLGRLKEKLGNKAQVYPVEEGKRQLRVSIADLLELLLR